MASLVLLVSLLAPLAAAQNTTSSTSTATIAEAACATGIHLIVARGSTEDPGPGRIGVVAGNVTDRVPGSTVAALDYPATLEDYFASESTGTAAMSAAIAAYAARCPDAPIALLGYSQGAQVVADALCGTSEPIFNATEALPARLADHVLAAVLFGDPSYVPGLPYDAGTSDHPGLFPRNKTTCAPFTDRIRSWCDEGDIYCAGGNITGVHGSYFANYTYDATDFIIDEYNKTREGGGGSTATVTTGAPSTTASVTGSASATLSGVPGNAAGMLRPGVWLVQSLAAVVAAGLLVSL